MSKRKPTYGDLEVAQKRIAELNSEKVNWDNRAYHSEHLLDAAQARIAELEATAQRERGKYTYIANAYYELLWLLNAPSGSNPRQACRDRIEYFWQCASALDSIRRALAGEAVESGDETVMKVVELVNMTRQTLEAMEWFQKDSANDPADK